MAAIPKRLYTEAEYLELERAASERHQYVNGEIIAMAGGTPRHARAMNNAGAAFFNALRQGPCATHSSEQRLRVDETGVYTYADLSVFCGPVAVSVVDRTALTNPTVVVEVLSKNTESDDRGWKFAHYRRMASLRAYVLIDPRDLHVEVFVRMADGRWAMSEAHGDSSIEIPPLEVTLSLPELFDKVAELDAD